MAIGAILQALAAGASGFGEGIGEAQNRFTQHQAFEADERYRQDLVKDRERGRARDQRLDIENRDYRNRQIEVETSRAETARIQAETAAEREARLSASARTDTNPVAEDQKARMQRAYSILEEIDPEKGLQMTDEELDRFARRRGFPGGFDEVVAATRPSQEWEPTPRARASMDAARGASGFAPVMDSLAAPQGGTNFLTPQPGLTAPSPGLAAPRRPTPYWERPDALQGPQARPDSVDSMMTPEERERMRRLLGGGG